MRRIFAAVCCVIMIAALAGCGKPAERELYNLKLSKYIDLGEYKGIEVDTSSDEFKEYYDSQISSDIENNNLYVKKTEGTVEDGDVANIDYEGKKDGVAFDGGTAAGYDLEIGSNSFIDGFEEGLIGVAIGSTVDLNLTFPEDYGNEELNGADVVFTVTVNYVTTDVALDPEEYYKELDFKTLKAYTDDVTKRAVKSCLVDKVMNSSEIKEYPEADIDTLYNAQYDMMDSYYQSYYGMTLESILSAQGMTADDFKTSVLEDYVYPMMDEQMTLYAIMDNEKDEVTTDEIESKITEELKNYSGIDRETFLSYYGEYYFEYVVVSEKVTEFLYENAVIK